MKKIHSLIILLLLSSAFITSAYAVKPDWNQAQSTEYAWHLSADVMRVPPYGSRDIPGSDTSSKLLINQPNGAVEVTITGVMNGLNPLTEYTVYLSKAYSLNVKRWSLAGDWVLRFLYGGNYDHDMTVTIQELDGSFEGYGGYPASGPPYTHEWTVAGTITGDDVAFHIEYLTGNPGYTVDAVGTIAADGTMSGTWSSSASQSGTWESLSGAATYTMIGTGWPGLFTTTIQPFTFLTDESGHSSWHLNIRDDDFIGPGTYNLSVWINEAGATILISDIFSVVVD